MSDDQRRSKAKQDEAAELRQQAEALWRRRTTRAPGALPDDATHLLHELEVHQIELEMQNAELRRAQEELAVAHARYFDLFDLAPVGYLTLDEQGLITEANLTAARLLGVERGQVVGQPLTRFILQDDQDIYYLHRKGLADTRASAETELRVQRRDGTVRWVHLQSLAGQDSDEAWPARMTLSDVTDRVEAEEQIRFQAGLLQAVDQAVVVSDLDTKVVYWNRYAEALYGWPAAEALGRGLQELFMRRSSTQELQGLTAGLRAGRGWSGEMEVTRRDGADFSALVDFSPVRDPQGSLVGIIIVSRDYSQRRRVEADLRLNREQLQNLSRHLVSLQEREREHVAHQLFDDESQRLAVVLLGLDRIEHHATGSPSIQSGITELKEIVDGLMRDLHALAFNLRPAVLDRLGLIAALRQYAEELSAKHALRIQVQRAGAEDLRLPADLETTVYRIVQEAITNAVRHSGARDIGIAVTRNEHRLVIVVEDDGAGFDVDEAIRRGRVGLLGMRERASMIGGTLTIESAPGKGTAVFVEVPLLPA